MVFLFLFFVPFAPFGIKWERAQTMEWNEMREYKYKYGTISMNWNELYTILLKFILNFKLDFTILF